MEDVDGEANVPEKKVSLDMLSKTAVVVKNDMVGLEEINTEDALEKFLKSRAEW
jgi:hypothetical protein